MQTTTVPAPNQTGLVSVGLRYGLFISLVWLIVDFLLRQVSLGFLSYGIVVFVASLVVSIIGVVLAHRAFKTGNEGLMSFGQGVIITLIMMLVWGFVSSVFNYLYVHYIDPAFVDKMRDDMVTFMEKNSIPQADIDKSTAKFEDMKGGLGKTLISGMTSGAITGVVLGLIISIFTKRNQAEFE